MSPQFPCWMKAASAAALLVGAASVNAQQQATTQVSPQPSAAAENSAGAQPQLLDANQYRTMKRDAPGTAMPAGYNPRFSPEGDRFIQQGGARIYQAVCQGCHMPQGQGAQGAGFYPALAKNPRLASGVYPTYVVLSGLHGMPPFAERLSDQQVADVVNYVRTSFGNNYQDAVTAEMVSGQRPAQNR